MTALKNDTVFSDDVFACTEWSEIPKQNQGKIGYCYWKQGCNETAKSFGGTYINFTLTDGLSGLENQTEKVISLKLKHLIIRLNKINATENENYCGLSLIGSGSNELPNDLSDKHTWVLGQQFLTYYYMIFDQTPKEKDSSKNYVNIGIAHKNIKYKWTQYKPKYSSLMWSLVTILVGILSLFILYFAMWTIRLYHLRNVK